MTGLRDGELDRARRAGGPTLTRRSLLQLTAGGALAGAMGLPLVSACTSAAVRPSAGSTAGILPTYVPVKSIKADLPGGAAGVRDEYLSYPRELVRSVSETPGRGGDLTALVIAFAQPPTPLAQNTYWQQMNQRLGVSYKPTIVADADWQIKLQTVMASDDLPDLMLMYPLAGVPHLLSFLQAKCQDVSDLLSGDAVKAYPNLANIPTQAWRSTAYGGRIYGLPQPRGAFGNNLFIHSDLAQQVAGTWQPTSADDFLRMMQALTQPQRGLWGMSASLNSNYNLDFFMQVFGAPNHWKVEGGKFSYYLETEQAKTALAYVRRLFQAGVYHPQANTVPTTQAKSGFWGSKFAAYQDGFSAYQPGWQSVKQIDPKFEPRVVIPFGPSGGKGTYWLGSGTFAFCAMKKTSKQRAQELLRIANYLAAPFGSQENAFLKLGVKDVDYTQDSSGNPVMTTRGRQENALYQGYIADAPSTLYDAQYPDFIRTIHGQEQQLIPLGVTDPTVGLYSEASTEKAATLATMLNDRLSAIIAGRAPATDYDNLLRDWRSQGGDQIRKEFEQAYASSKKS
jgi:putative aldouronate transport system substrate-binding protein